MDNATLLVFLTVILSGVTYPFFRRYLTMPYKRSRGHSPNGASSYWYAALAFLLPFTSVMLYGVAVAADLSAQAGLSTEEAISLFTPHLMGWMWVTAFVFLPISGFWFAMVATQRGLIRVPWMKRLVKYF